MSCIVDPPFGAAEHSQQSSPSNQTTPPPKIAAGTATRRLIPVTEWHNHHQYPPIGQLRALIFNARNNGFDHCVRRIGRRVLIDEAAYFEWVDRHGSR